MPQSYLSHLHHFLTFLTAYIHTLLALRDLYPRATFLIARFHNTPIFQSRHPTLCTWITDAVSAVRTELLAGTVARIAVVIYHLPPSSPSGATKVLERHLIDVSRFPAVPKQDWETDTVFAPAEPAPAPAPAPDQTKGKTKTKPKPLDANTPVDLAEQFRAALIQLTTRCGRLAPLPPHCSFSLALELKDDADPPVGHPQPWIPVQPSLQKTRRTEAGLAAGGSASAGAEMDESGRSDGSSSSSSGGPAEGADLGGARTMPIRAVEAGVLRFEMWVEEGKAKFEMQAQGSGSVESEGG